MDQVHKPSNSVCCTPSSKHFRVNVIHVYNEVRPGILHIDTEEVVL
jgi:hypothetical protein